MHRLRAALFAATISFGVMHSGPAAGDLIPAAFHGRTVAAVIDCLFNLPCALGDFSGDALLSVADVSAAQQLVSGDPASYRRVTVSGDPSATGIFDASLSFPADSDVGWMAYSGVDYHDAGGVLVRDVTTRLASSSDGGLSWEMRATLSPPEATTVTVGNAEICGDTRCAGRMISEVPFLVDDVADTDAQRRFKLFAHRYFVYPQGAPDGHDLQRQLGSITLRTAPAAEGPWSDDRAWLGWDLTPPEIDTAININRLNGMESCFAVSEGGAVAFGDDLDLVFTCPQVTAGALRQRIVLLRSRDHTASVDFVVTLLDASDADSLGADDLSAPSLFAVDERAYLLVTPVIHSAGADRYAGCVVIALADRAHGQVERDRDGQVVVRQFLATDNQRFGGACAWDSRAVSGIVMSQLFFTGATPSFRLFDTATPH